MKKYILTFLAAVLGTGAAFAQDGKFPLDSVLNPSVSNLSVSASVGIESQYVFRGEKLAGISLQPEVQLSYPIAGFDVYGGAWANTPLQKKTPYEGAEVDLCAGANYQISALTLDLGYVYYWYTDNAPDSINHDQDVYFGISLDTSSFLRGFNLNPALYYFYNLDLKQHVIEASLGHEFELGALAGIEALTFPVRGYLGWLTADEYNGIPDNKYSYWYAGATADVAYALTEFCKISAGVRYSYKHHGDETLNIDDKHEIWWGAKVSFGF